MRNQECNFITPRSDEYSMGIELEFYIRNVQGLKKYYKDLNCRINMLNLLFIYKFFVDMFFDF